MFPFSFMRKTSSTTNGAEKDEASFVAVSLRDLAVRAVAEDERGNYNVAVQLYTELIEKLLLQLKQTGVANEQQELRRKTEGYMSRAEFINPQTD
ncbi:Aste57867_15771 [Aphanomyces stellatus]|uniref:Aste57867_15771 protein n=1 Tax=Aphanomyces stellatus TaxID=120398 RepID=A0A485L4V4_9STRA|nr:hypothetical protein As57867_015715 [Aphanomyces stellatus]VFT92559.1 Aste57867_15771 [Aphanomyces stellatus]